MTSPASTFFARVDQGLTALSRFIWRSLLLVLGLGFVLLALLLALFLGLLTLLWALLRGRKPAPMGFGWTRAGQGMPAWARPGRPAPGARSGAGEVVDVEAREVPPSSERLP